MKVIYISPSELPSKAAHTVHIAKMAEAFAKNGNEVILVLPLKNNHLVNDNEIFEFYNIEPLIKIEHFRFDKRRLQFFNIFKVIKWLYSRKDAVIVSRNLEIAMFATLFGLKIIFDAHKIPEIKGYRKWFLKRFCVSRNLARLTVVASGLKEHFENLGVDPKKIFIVRNGTNNVTDFDKIEFIANNDKFNIGYVGHLYPGKGMEVIESLAPFLNDVIIHIVGGNEKDVLFWREKIKSENIVFYGFQQQKQLSKYINSFDICLLPNQSKVMGYGSKRDIGSITCPLKMFDYMAHKKPIIASDLPVLREVLNEEVAVFCDPLQPAQWLDAINRLKNDYYLKSKLAENAYLLFKNNYTWQKRAQQLIEGIG